MAASQILFIDDDADVLKAAELLLCKAGYRFFAARTPDEAYSLLAVERVDAIFLDLNFSRARMSGEEGLACLAEIHRHDPDAVVLVVTGHSGLIIAVQAIRAGAHNFIMKPWHNERLLEALNEALKSRIHKPVRAGLADAGQEAEPLVGDCEAMVRVKALVERYAPLNAAVLLLGESGTGKSLTARNLHRHSRQKHLKVIEGGDLRIADLDHLSDTSVLVENIDQLDSAVQAPLLSWLQQAARDNNRLIATSCRTSLELGLNRALVYALSTLEMTLPPLKDRGQDIDGLAGHFSRIFALRHGMTIPAISPEGTVALRSVVWADNLHALRKVIERAVATSAGTVISPADMDLPSMAPESMAALGLNLERTEKYMIEEALKRHNFNVSKAASELGLTRQTLYRRMERHGL
ncbi:MAG: response regulator [Asticcacaulis sp.]